MNHFLAKIAMNKRKELRQVAKAMLSGVSCGFAFHDLCLEEALFTMQSLSSKVGKKMLFCTFGHYYLGRVKEVTETDVILVNCSRVFDEGEAATAFAENGHMNYKEDFPPKDEIILNKEHIVVAIPFHGALNGE